MRVRHDPPCGRNSLASPLFALLVPMLLTACGGDDDAGGSGEQPTTKPPPDGTTSTTDPPTTGASETVDPTTGVVDPTTTTDEPDTTTTGVQPDPLTIDCGAPPPGAKAAKYSHQPSAMGGTPAYTWSASGLPDGVTIDAGSGLITGQPQVPGDYAFELTVTDNGGMSAMTTCPNININDQFGVDLDAMLGPCIGEGESLLDYIVGGDGSPVECVAPKGIGDGTLPAGITIEKAKCTHVGAITETRYGTFAWIVRARQSGVDVFAPYCATQDKQAATAYAIVGNHSGGLDNELEPLELSVKGGQPLLLDGDADPGFVIDKGVCGASCFFGFLYQVSPSPFGTGACTTDKDKCYGMCPLVADANEPDGDKQIGCSLVPMMGLKTGFAHELWAKGDVLPAEFQARPFVLQWLLDYCITNVQGECTGKDPILANGGDSNLAFPIIVRPQP